MTDARIFVVGHRGLVGSAIVRNLLARGVRPDQLILRTHAELDLTDGRAVDAFFAAERPTQVYVAAERNDGLPPVVNVAGSERRRRVAW